MNEYFYEVGYIKYKGQTHVILWRFLPRSKRWVYCNKKTLHEIRKLFELLEELKYDYNIIENEYEGIKKPFSDKKNLKFIKERKYV